MSKQFGRREFLQTTGAACAAVGLIAARAAGQDVGGEDAGATRAQQAGAQAMPQIKLGTLAVSRMILGSNQFFGYSHMSGERDRAMREYFTDERIMAILDEAAGLGVTSVSGLPGKRWYELWKKYSAGGGRMPTWIAQPMGGTDEAMIRDIEESAKNGAKAIYIQGHKVEDSFDSGKGELVRGWVARIKKCGVAAGLACHRPHVLPQCEKLGYGADFYFQCCYIPDNFKPEERDRAMETLKLLPKPVIAYKVMGAGRNKPDEAFEFIFKHLRPGDGLCVGVFPKDKAGILAENVALVLKHSGR
jgi:hypothetical protein